MRPLPTGLALVMLVASGGAAPTSDPPRPARLEIVNVTAAFGRLGPARDDHRVRPYDQIFFRYDVVGVLTNAASETVVTTAVSVTDSAGKSSAAMPVTARLPLAFGGDRLPGFATAVFTPEHKPGRYLFRVQVTDMLSGAKAEFERELELLPLQLAIVSLNFSTDAAGDSASPASGPVGSTLFARFQIVGFMVRDGTGRPRIEVEVATRLLDRDGKPLTPHPAVQKLKSEDAKEVKDAVTLTVVNALLLSRVGQFQFEIVATDKLTGRTARQVVPVLIMPLPDQKPDSLGRN